LKSEGDLFTTFDFKKFGKVPEMKNDVFNVHQGRTPCRNLARSLAKSKIT
jgi:hypothetical protein